MLISILNCKSSQAYWLVSMKALANKPVE